MDSIKVYTLENAQNGINRTIQLLDEMGTITGAYAMVTIPVEGAVELAKFQEEGQFQFLPLTLKFNKQNRATCLQIVFGGLQGRTPTEEEYQDLNKVNLFRPLALNEKLLKNESLKVKFRNDLAKYRFPFTINLILTYTEKP